VTTTDKTTEPADVFDAHLARWEAAEADPDGTVERVARAIYEAEEAMDWPEDERRTWEDVWGNAQGHYRRLAAAAIAALRPAPDAPRVDLSEWDCICGSGDDGEWHSLLCAAHNTPDDVFYGETTEDGAS
jgi:hypothetical protein